MPIDAGQTTILSRSCHGARPLAQVRMSAGGHHEAGPGDCVADSDKAAGGPAVHAVDTSRHGARPSAVARVDASLQRDFGLHHTLSLYLVDAVAALDPGSPDYALDVISISESILENPRALLEAQVRARKTELVDQMKAERVPYDERMARLENVTWDKPIAPFLYSTFELFAEGAKFDGPIEFLDELYLAEPKAIVEAIRDHAKSAGRVMVVGHNPGLEGLVASLTADHADLPTSAFVECTVPIDTWADLDLDTPGRLRAIFKPKDER